jgi:hypothetical protein
MACEKQWSQYDGKSTEQLLQDQYLKLIDRTMCSDICPCNDDYQTKWLGVADDYLRKYTRANVLTPTETADYA